MNMKEELLINMQTYQKFNLKMQEQKKVQSKIVKQEKAFEGKWIGLKYVTFSVGQKIIPNYEAVYRTTRKQNVHVDGVEIIPIIKYKQKPSQLVVIANFRPPIGKFSLQFPSGLVQSQDFQENVRRQLRQQTGYQVSKFIQIPYPVMYADPWKSNQNGLLYIAIIDGDDPKSKTQQTLQEAENIRVHVLPFNKDLPKTIHQLAQKNNYGIEDKIWSLCIGIIISDLIK